MAKIKKKKTTKKMKKKILRRAHDLRSEKRGKVLVRKNIRRAGKPKRKNPKTKEKVFRKKIKNSKVKKVIKHREKVIKKAHKITSKIIKKHTAKRPKTEPATEFPAEALFKAKIKVIGIGGGGGSIVSEIGRSLEKATFVIADTDIRALKKKSGIKYFWFGEELTHGLGTGVNVELAKQAAESAKEKISTIFKDQDIVIFVASLGGGLGSGATQVFAEAAREFGGITFGIFTMPFKFEGKNKYRIAQNALKSLRKSLNVSLVIPNEKIFKIIDESTPITDAFSTVNESLIESLESLIDLIYNPGIINIDFADLRTILKGRGNTAFLNTVEESGKDRIEKICENIFKNPLLQNTGFAAEKILFNIVGSENLSMFEVEKISAHIANANQKAKIIFGISKNNKLKNKIRTTILMTGGQIEESPVKAAVIEQTKEVAKAKVLTIKKKTREEKPNESASDSNKKSGGSKSIKNKKTKEKSKKPSLPGKKTSGEPQEAPHGQNPVSIIPVFEVPTPALALDLPILEQKEASVAQTTIDLGKKTIRRSGLEIRKAEELEEKKRIAQEKEWEIPAFLRKVKFKS